MEKENYNYQMEVFIKVNGLMEKLMVRDNLIFRMEKNIKEVGKII